MTGRRVTLRGIGGWRVTLFASMLVLGFVIAAQAAAEGPRVRYTSQERAPLIETALDLQARADDLKARILDLRERIGQLERTDPGAAAVVAELNASLDAARLAAGLVAIGGPGLVLRVEDADPGRGGDGDRLVTARDLRTLVEELFLAGAEAVSINGERVVSTTALVDIGGSVLANSAYLAPPFDVSAIGPPGLYGRLGASATFLEFVRARVDGAGLRLSYAELADVVVPAYAGGLNVRQARPTASEEPAP